MPLEDPRLQKLVTDYLSWARGNAWRWFQRLHPADLDELYSISLEALCLAAEAYPGYCEARGFSAWQEDGRIDPHWEAYVSHRMRGAVLDWARRADHVSRSNRAKLREIEAARQDGARTDAELAGATGLTTKQVRTALAADGLKALSLDTGIAVDGGAEVDGSGLADTEPGVESQAMVSTALAAFMKCFDQLDAETQVILALRHFHGLELAEVAEKMFTTVERVRELHQAGIFAIHNALLTAVSTG